MPGSPTMTNDEKRCLSEAASFLNEAMKQVHFDGNHFIMESTIHETFGPMLSGIAIDKYRECKDQLQKSRPRPQR